MRYYNLVLLVIFLKVFTYRTQANLGLELEEANRFLSFSSAENSNFDGQHQDENFGNNVQTIFVDDAEAEVQIEDSDGESSESLPMESKRPMLEITEYIPPSKSKSQTPVNDSTAVAMVYDDGTGAIGQEDGKNETNVTKQVANTTVSCNLRELPIGENGSVIEPSVEIVNTTILHLDVLWMNTSIKTRATPSNCSIVLFYVTWCPFSSKAAPHFNALARAFPDIRVVAIDSAVHSSVNSFFGILSVPTILLFHNGKTVAKFNDTSFSVNKFAEFIHVFTDLKSDENITVTSQDFLGPLSSIPSETRDIWLYIAWIFIIVCFIHYAAKSTLWRKVSELVRTTWREAEAQHEHTD